MLRKQAQEEDSTILIDMAPGAENGDSYGSTANTSEVKLRRQPLASPPWDPGPQSTVDLGGLSLPGPEPPPPGETQSPGR